MTEKLLSPLRTRPWPERWLTRVLGAALSGTAYLLCLPWDLRDRVRIPGASDETTPVPGAGVLLLAAALLLLAAYFGHRDALAWPLLLVAVPPAVLMHLSLRTHPGPPDGFAHAWPLVWAFHTLVIATGVLVAAAVARQFRDEPQDDETVFAHTCDA
ncbi:hypothetical protein ACIPJS_27835 [Streptomyces sp. NPDC086783]|uniref:hypothetical protein n=1 Tax=Streptomyces sp. NPDC086783 TaxID=3365758 RepID=UPI00380742D1